MSQSSSDSEDRVPSPLSPPTLGAVQALPVQQKYRMNRILVFPDPEREYLVYKLKEEQVKKRLSKNYRDSVIVPYFLLSIISLYAAHWIYKKGLNRFRYSKWIFGAIVAHFGLVFTPMWHKICRGRNLFNQSVERLTLQ